MCGIIGYVGYRNSQDVLVSTLRKLEYRGYDSAGVAWLEGGRTFCVRAVGNLDALGAALNSHGRRRAVSGPAVAVAEQPSVGIGHTRWATHGAVSERNAHPHADPTGRIRIVLNGIIENHLAIRKRVVGETAEYRSETDAEAVAHLLALNYDGDLADAVRCSLPDLTGHYAFVAMCEDEPDMLVCVRHECPLVLGIGDGEQFVASSMSAFLEYTHDTALLSDDEVAVLRPDEVSVLDRAMRARSPVVRSVAWDEERCEKGGFETFMLKEIHEQPAAAASTLAHWQAHAHSDGDSGLSDAFLRRVDRIVIVGCGTSYHAGLAGRVAIERWARIPVDVEVASEFRYRDPIVAPGTLLLGITQSGETADTLAAMRLARDRGARVIAITNVPGSQATRDSDAVLFTRAGIEIGVAATKTFVAQVVLLCSFAVRLAGLSSGIPSPRVAELRTALELLPAQLTRVLESSASQVEELADRLRSSPFFLYLGRLSGLPVALEGALKLKEISYVPTDAYAAGEMKHGPIALLSSETPVVCVATEEAVLPKLLSNLCEVRARGAPVVVVASEGCYEIAEHADDIVRVPRTDPVLQIPLSVVPLQLFAYHAARFRGLNVDQPRNLAKTVTVE
jgi:glutamine---fructose-6-phosphate transaminase (isomerizing)